MTQNSVIEARLLLIIRFKFHREHQKEVIRHAQIDGSDSTEQAHRSHVIPLPETSKSRRRGRRIEAGPPPWQEETASTSNGLISRELMGHRTR